MPKPQSSAPAVTSEMQTAINVASRVRDGSKALGKTLAFLTPLLRQERPASELAHLYGQLRDMRDMLSEAMKPLDEALTKTGDELIPNAFEREKLSSFTTSDGYRVGISHRYFVSMKDKDACMAWLEQHGLGALIQSTVNASTLSAAGKKELEAGRELPEELFAAFFKAGTSLTKTKK